MNTTCKVSRAGLKNQLETTVVVKIETIAMKRNIARQIRWEYEWTLWGQPELLVAANLIGHVAKNAVENGSYAANFYQLADGSLLFVGVHGHGDGPQIFIG